MDTAEEAAKAGARCGFDPAGTKARFIFQAAAGSCKSVTSIRDENALRTQCFAWLASTPCHDLLTQMLDDSCKQQLVRGVLDAGRD